MVLFIFKKVVALLLSPVAVPVDLLVLGVVLLLFTRRQKAGKALVSAGTLLLLLLSNKIFSSMLLRPLEYRYPPLLAVPEGSGQGSARRVKYVVVLAGGFEFDPKLTPLSQLRGETMIRLAEGVRMYRELPGARLIVSGGGRPSGLPEAPAMAKVAESLGVSPQDILLEKESIDTESEARLVKPMVGAEPFVLVTSASHMPRAMALFRKQGTSPIPDPTDYLIKGPDELKAGDLYPSDEGLKFAGRAIYEYGGLAWETLRGHI
jgi:uncharacterized SAM-binding protein YcdF (DUF218 family)